MVKWREANYCNLKLLLIFLVVYGHWIEPYIHQDEALLSQYRFISWIAHGAGHGPWFSFPISLQGSCVIPTPSGEGTETLVY